MKKSISLIALFVAFTITLGFSSTNANENSSNNIAPYNYTLITHDLGTIYIQEGMPYTFTIYHSGTYTGLSASFRKGYGSYDYIWMDTFSVDGIHWGCSSDGNCHNTSYSHIGDVYTVQNGRYVIYQVIANVIAQ